MSKKFIHLCSSVLLRPNGITRFINTTTQYQLDLGHEVLVVTDSIPTQTILAPVICHNNASLYVPNMHPTRNHVWLQISNQIINEFKTLSVQFLHTDWYKLICHDLHSFIAMEQLVPASRHKDIIFIQHESDVQNSPDRWSYVGNEYLKMQINIVENTNCTIASVSPYLGNHISKAKNLAHLPIPFTPAQLIQQEKTRDLIYIGEANDRKNPDEFVALAEQLGVNYTIISHDRESERFKQAEVLTFTLDQKEELFKCVASAKVAFLPSRSECLGLVVIECLQYIPTVINANYAWTTGMESTGAIVTSDPATKIKELLNMDQQVAKRQHLNRGRLSLERWSLESKNLWKNL